VKQEQGKIFVVLQFTFHLGSHCFWLTTIIVFLKRFIAQKISNIHLVTKDYKNCSLNQFAFVVARWARGRVSALLGSFSVAVKNKYKGKTLRQLGRWL
jgi:hypothetical protein